MTAAPYTNAEIEELVGDGIRVAEEGLDQKIMRGIERRIASKEERTELDAALTERQDAERSEVNQWLAGIVHTDDDDAARSRAKSGDAGNRGSPGQIDGGNEQLNRRIRRDVQAAKAESRP